MFFKKKNYDFIAIGDLITDAFIDLSDAWVEDDNPEKKQELCMHFGEKIPYKHIDIIPAVGNSPNAAVAAHRLGISSALVSDCGNDMYGREQLQSLKKEGLSKPFIHVHKDMQSNYNLILRWKAERTILVKHQQYPYTLPHFNTPKWLYLSSLAENSIPFHEKIGVYLKKHPGVKLAFQPGTFQIQLGYEVLKKIYEHTHIFFCNKTEAQKITESSETNIPTLLRNLHERGPSIVVITDGKNGAYVYDGHTTWHGPIYPDPKEPVDRTGAGDAFASTFVSALILGKSIEEALRWAPINSMSVVQYVGSKQGLLSQKEIQSYLDQAPEYYTPQKLDK